MEEGIFSFGPEKLAGMDMGRQYCKVQNSAGWAGEVEVIGRIVIAEVCYCTCFLGYCTASLHLSSIFYPSNLTRSRQPSILPTCNNNNLAADVFKGYFYHYILKCLRRASEDILIS